MDATDRTFIVLAAANDSHGRRFRGEPVRRRNLPSFELSIDAHIPEAYIPTAQQKMTQT